MRICLLSREFPPDTGWGGIGTYTYQIARALAQLKHEVHVISLAAESQPDSVKHVDEGYTVHRVAWQGLLDELNLFLVSAPSLHFVAKTGLAIWRRFLQLHKEKPFDVVEAPEHLAVGFFNAITATAPLVVKLHTPHAKFVSDNYNQVLPSFDNQMIAMLEQAGMVQAEVLCSPSLDLAEFVAKHTGVPLDSIHIVRNPVDSERFAPASHGHNATKESLIVLHVGRLEQRKGVTCLADAVPFVCASVPNAKFVFVGADTPTAPGGGSMLSYLKDKLKACGISDKVEFQSHAVLNEMPAVYGRADVCVIPSLYDNAPYTCLEALSCGRPVVVSDSGGTKEYVVEGQTGFVVPSQSPEPLAKAIACLLADAQMRGTFGENARQYALSNLSPAVIAKQMESLYNEAIDSFSKQKKLYLKPPEESMLDALRLLCAYDASLFDTLYNQSFDFKVRYFLRLFKRRPSLCLATLSVAFCKLLKLEKIAAVKRLQAAVDRKQGTKYAQTLELAVLDSGTLVQSAAN